MRTSAGPFGPASAATVRCTLDATATPQANKHAIVRHRLAFADRNLFQVLSYFNQIFGGSWSFLSSIFRISYNSTILGHDMTTTEFDDSVPSDTDSVLGPASSIVDQSHAASRAYVKGATAQKERKRGNVACQRCRKQKSKCINEGSGTQCKSCNKHGRSCTYEAATSVSKAERSLEVSCHVQYYQHGFERETKP
jgi:ribosomal protein L37AE/L43A